VGTVGLTDQPRPLGALVDFNASAEWPWARTRLSGVVATLMLYRIFRRRKLAAEHHAPHRCPANSRIHKTATRKSDSDCRPISLRTGTSCDRHRLFSLAKPAH